MSTPHNNGGANQCRPGTVTPRHRGGDVCGLNRSRGTSDDGSLIDFKRFKGGGGVLLGCWHPLAITDNAWYICIAESCDLFFRPQISPTGRHGITALGRHGFVPLLKEGLHSTQIFSPTRLRLIFEGLRLNADSTRCLICLPLDSTPTQK